jgi:hypothetical protein
MKRQLLLFTLIACAWQAWGQGLKPIPQMVQSAHADGSIQQMSLFASAQEDISQVRGLTDGLLAGVVLEWDAQRVEAVRAMAQSAFTLQVPAANGKTWTLDLVPARNFSDAFAVHDAATGLPLSVDQGTHFWGIVRGDDQSWVSISVFNHEIIGLIATPTGNWVLGAIAGDKRNAHILYRSSDLKGNSNFDCLTDDELHKIGETQAATSADRSTGPTNCVRMFVEADYTLFQNKGSAANVTSYMTGVFSQVSALYTNEQVNLVLHDLFVWSTNDPYTGPSASNYLTQFRTAKNGVFNGDLAHLVGIHNLGGVAYLDVLCNPAYGVGYSSINATYSNVPTYSWTIEVLTHEIGHNLGSSHTHACVWNGNNTAIDGCGPTAGYSEGCTAPLPTNGGTIMSYCHLVSGVGINFANGFGPQPGTRIRNEVYNAACLAACGGGGGACNYSVLNSNNFEANFGIWTDGGTDCIRTSNATYANTPTYSIQLRDNTNTSVLSTVNQNWAPYSKVKIEFSSYSVSFENGEDYWVQLSINGGSTYTTKATYVAGTDFTNGVRKFVTLEIDGPFSTTSRLRLRADASDDGDQVYFDDVVISACTQQFTGGGNGEREEVWVDALQTAEAPALYELKVSPNPASEWLNIAFVAEADMPVEIAIADLTGRITVQQRLEAVRGENAFRIPAQGLQNGFYILRAQSGDNQLEQKVMIAR